jgi:hypothetical protein
VGRVCERGEWPVLFADWMEWHPLLVEDNAGGADDVCCGTVPDKYVVTSF